MASSKKTDSRSTAGTATRERRFQGLGVSPGIVVGPLQVRDLGTVEAPLYSVPRTKVAAEQKRLEQAVEVGRRQIRRLQDRARKLPGETGAELVFLFDAYLQMLDDSRLVRGAAARIADEGVNAEAAVEREIAAIAEGFEAMDDAYIAARLDDIREVGARIVHNLLKKPAKALKPVARGTVLVAENIGPADMAQIDPARVGGVVAVLGGAEGHAAIIARALGLPAVMGVHGLLPAARDAERILVDGYGGEVILDPSPATLDEFARRRERRQRETRRLERLKDLPAVTRDGTDIVLQANVELPVELDMVEQAGAAGIGLLRTEFMFMNRAAPPDEEEQTAMMSAMVEAMGERPLTIRTLDIGADKPIAEGTLGEFEETAATALGLRGIRLSLMRRDLIEAQFRAILRAAGSGPGNVRILLPMVSRVSEVRRARQILQKVHAGMRRRREKVPAELPPVGAMIEVPGAALAADALAEVCDFFSIGSNDLTMYTLAIDRANEHVAHLYDALHPAVLRLMQFAAESAMRRRLPVSICGEMAGDPRYTPLLLGLGVRELSMTAASIPRVKQRVREIELTAATRRAQLIMDQVDSGRIATLLDDFNGLA